MARALDWEKANRDEMPTEPYRKPRRWGTRRRSKKGSVEEFIEKNNNKARQVARSIEETNKSIDDAVEHEREPAQPVKPIVRKKTIDLTEKVHKSS